MTARPNLQHEEARQAAYDVADSNRKSLIDAHIAGMSMSDILDVLGEFGREETEALKQLCADHPDFRFCKLFCGHVDRLYGEQLVNAAADRIDLEERGRYEAARSARNG